MTATVVTFPSGTTAGTSAVLASGTDAQGAFAVLAETPFHPVDHTWPDQPGDTGTLEWDGGSAVVTDTVMAAREGDGDIVLGTEIPVKRGAEGWTWLVAHRTDAVVPEGATATASVDVGRRAALSRAHTACHLASLALDGALADLWRKDPGADTLGNPDFERRAGQSSVISADASVDEYRLGKSLRKAGFDTEMFAATLAERQLAVNAQLEGWVSAGGRSWIETEGDTITDRRTWHCALPQGEAEFLCGGTHAASLDEFAAITVELDLADPQLLVMRTHVRAA